MYIHKTKNMVLRITKCVMLFSVITLTLTSCTSYDKPAQNKEYSIDNSITLEQVTQDVSFLASDALQGRSNFTPSIIEAADYIAKRFNDIGLSPVTGETNFQQEYTLQRIIPDHLTVIINGKKINQEHLAMVTTTSNFQWDSLETLEQLDNSTTIPSAINLVFINEDVNMRKALRTLNNAGGEHLVLLHPKHKKSFKRYQSHFAKGAISLAENNTSNISGGTIVMALTDIEQVKQYQVKGNTTISKTDLSNVVGIIPGKTKADEIVLFSAHYDHLGIKENNTELPLQTGNIYNGADDNASGVTALIQLASYFAKSGSNERTIMFAAFSAEELGGLGSKYFSEQIPSQTITAMINIEMIGKPAVFGNGTVWMTGMERSNLGEQLNKTLAASGLTIYADPYPQEKLFYRSDNATLARLGVPAHSFSSTQLDKDKHYHEVTDDINSLNIPSMLKVIKTLATATLPLTKGTFTPSRIDPNKVKNVGEIY